MINKKPEVNKCWLCDGMGKYKKPNNQEKYEEAFDRYDGLAYFINMKEAREKALEDVGYTEIECPDCGGTGIAK